MKMNKFSPRCILLLSSAVIKNVHVILITLTHWSVSTAKPTVSVYNGVEQRAGGSNFKPPNQYNSNT